MKKKLLLSITLLLYVAGFAQKQVTNVHSTQTLNTLLEPIGQIGRNYFFLNPGHSIEKADLESMTLQNLLTFTKDPSYNYMPIVASGRLFLGYFDWNVNETKIFGLDPETGKYMDSLIIPNSNDLLFSSDSYYVIHNNSQQVQQIRFNEKGYSVSEVLGSDLRRYTRNLLNHIVSFKDAGGNTVHGFFDRHGTFHETGPTGYAVFGTEYTDYYVFLPLFDVNEAYIYHKADKTTTRFFSSDNRSRKNFQFFEFKEELYALEELTAANSKKYFFYKYKGKEDAETLFSGEIPTYMFYQIGGWITGGGKTYTYSNPLFDGKSLYFWGNDVNDRVSVKTLKLYNLDIGSKSVSAKPITDNGIIDSLKISEYLYGLKLDYFNNAPTTSTSSEPSFSFSLNAKTGDFEPAALLYQKEIIRVSDSLSLNLSYPQRVIFQNSRKQRIKTLRSGAAGGVDALKRYFIDTEQLVIPDEQNWDVYVYSGDNLMKISSFLEKDFLQVKEKTWSEVNAGNKYILYVHGLRSGGTSGSNYYTFDTQTRTFERFYTHDAAFINSHFTISKPKYGSFVLINLPGNKAVISDFKNHFELDHEGPAELVHSFSNQTFVVSFGNSGTYFFDPEKAKPVKISNVSLVNTNTRGDTFVYPDSGALVRIDGSGKEEILVYASQSPVLTRISDTELIFTTSGKTGLINTTSGKISVFSSPAKGPGIDKFFTLSGQIYGLSLDMKLYSVDFEKGELTRLSNRAFGREVEINGTAAYLTEFASPGNKYEVWKLEGQKLEHLLSTDDARKIYPLARPLILKDPGQYRFWLPESEKWTSLSGPEIDSFHYFEYLTRNGQISYFRGYKPGDDRFYLLKVDTNTLKIKTMWSGEGFEFIFKIFKNEVYLATQKGLWKSSSDGEDMLPESGLIYAPFGKDGREPFLEFRNNLYLWGHDDLGFTQLFRLTENEAADVLLPTENPALSFMVYPNPTAGYLTIRSTTESPAKYKITVFSTEGKLLSEKESGLPQKLDLSNYKSGIYLINVRSEQESKTFRVMRN